MKKRDIQKNKRGFTLVELIISVGLFLIMVSITSGALGSIIDANRRVQSNKAVLDSFTVAIETMTRFIRFGTSYHCGSGGTISLPQNCSNNTNGDDYLAVNFQGATYIFRKDGDKITFSKNAGVVYTDLTPEGVVITDLKFRTYGTTVGDVLQPYVIVNIKGYTKSGATSQVDFDIQTVMSQREVDI